MSPWQQFYEAFQKLQQEGGENYATLVAGVEGLIWPAPPIPQPADPAKWPAMPGRALRHRTQMVGLVTPWQT